MSAARALSPWLRCHPRDPSTEARRLKQLAGWCRQFTPLISLQPPDALLLEIGASLRYFHGLEALCSRVEDGIQRLGHEPLLAVAPTPTAAWLFARAREPARLHNQAECNDALEALSVTALPDDDSAAPEALLALGCTTLGDCLALPREGLARRFGHRLLRRLDRARGDHPDPRKPWQPDPRVTAPLSPCPWKRGRSR
ncbi:MAG: DNA polymerase Y family protein [Arhodomonas sp.]|nr:DNA polymerase Y family protein [Arhodomonas sp.]